MVEDSASNIGINAATAIQLGHQPTDSNCHLGCFRWWEIFESVQTRWIGLVDRRIPGVTIEVYPSSKVNRVFAEKPARR